MDKYILCIYASGDTYEELAGKTMRVPTLPKY